MSKIIRINLIPSIIQKIVIRYSSTESVTYSKDCTAKNSNIDYKDVKLHSTLKADWWNINGPLHGLHSLNKIRVPFIRDGLINLGHKPSNPSQSLKGLSILDVACGGGILSEPLARIGASVTGIDASAELIEVAKQHAILDPETSNINYINCSVEEMAVTPNNKFDAVIASEIIEHVIDKKSFLKACTQLLKPGGSIFITTLNKNLPSYVAGIILAEYLLSIVPRGTHNWEQFITPEETRRILSEYNCDTKLIHGTFYDIIRHQWHWTSSTIFSYALQAMKSKTSEEN